MQFTLRFTFLLFAVAVSACSDRPDQVVAPDGSLQTQTQLPAVAAARAVSGLERHFLAINDSVPGFGGYFIAEDGDVVVYLKDPTALASERARGIIVPLLQERRWSSRQRFGRLSIREGQFEFAELYEWRDSLISSVLHLPGVVSVDLDERRNTVVIGVLESSITTEVERAIALLGAPAGAVMMEASGPLILEAGEGSSGMSSNLNSMARPFSAGYQVIGYTDPTETEGGCSIGPIVIRNGIRNFMTAGHCAVQWGLDAADYFQPTRNTLNDVPTTTVGYEVADPPGWSCDVIYKCRASEVSFIQISDTVDATAGTIARTQALGSLVIDAAQPYWYTYGVATTEPRRVSRRTQCVSTG